MITAHGAGVVVVVARNLLSIWHSHLSILFLAKSEEPNNLFSVSAMSANLSIQDGNLICTVGNKFFLFRIHATQSEQ